MPAYLILGTWTLFTFVALFWIVNASLKTNQQVFRAPFQLPQEFQFVNYENVFKNYNFGMFFGNSLIYVVFSVGLILLISTPA